MSTGNQSTQKGNNTGPANLNNSNTVPNFRVIICEELREFIQTEAAVPDKELPSLPYLKLRRLAVQMRYHKNAFMLWGHKPTVIDDGQNSFLLICDFIVKVNIDYTFCMYYQHRRNAVYMENGINEGAMLKALERYAQMNPAAYDPNDNLPF